MISAQRLLQVLGALIICGWLFAGAGDGLNASFTTDDLVNMTSYQSRTMLELIEDNVLYFSPSYRPMGALFYRPLFAVFGLTPLPFRIVSVVLLTINLGLAFTVFRWIAGSGHIAALATLMFTFHPRLVDLYWSSGTIYDILCFTFVVFVPVVSASPREPSTSRMENSSRKFAPVRVRPGHEGNCRGVACSTSCL